MYEIIINSNKSIQVNKQQFSLLKLIGQLGFVNFNQLTLLWSVVNKTYVGFSHSTIRRWINNYHLLRKRPVTASKKQRSSSLSRPVYYLSTFGIRLLRKYHVDYVPFKYLNFNSHNDQCNEVTVQTLFKATFDIDLLNNPHLQPKFQQTKNLVASPTFNLKSLNLSPWSKQVPNYKMYPFVPDQMISFQQNKQKCEIMIELDNRTENDNVQLQKIFNYLIYANKNPNKRILMVIAITDGSLSSYKVPTYRSIHNKVNNLLTKFKNNIVTINHHQYSLASLYKSIKNLTITIAGVKEAHVDLADFIINKNCVTSSISASQLLASSLTKKFGRKVIFKRNNKINSKALNYLNIQSLTIGYIVYNSNPAIYQPVILGYEHSLDTYLDLCQRIPQNCIYTFPIRSRKLLTPAIPNFYQQYSGQTVFSPKQSMLYQPILEDNLNPNWLLQLSFAKEHYSQYLYSFFVSGHISVSETTDYSNLTYIHSKAVSLLNQYLSKYHIKLTHDPIKSYQLLNKIALQASSSKEFMRHVNVQDIPIQVIQSIFKQIPIKGFSSPYFATSSLYSKFYPTKYLYLPDKINPRQRSQISF